MEHFFIYPCPGFYSTTELVTRHALKSSSASITPPVAPSLVFPQNRIFNGFSTDSMTGVTSNKLVNLMKSRGESSPRIGSEHQAEIPDLLEVPVPEEVICKEEVGEEDSKPAEMKEEMVWDPACAQSITDLEMRHFLGAARSVASGIPAPGGGSRNIFHFSIPSF